eukprot:NODE_8548_length_1488_cov_2.739162.p4 GENE.NODE_8548_length_1488_cov_2.739162~~NODE_8548_length_1488_cov_2.739162.p4  ORF type:complete len:140 (-),score=31.01 NODE_8548_length_1488_cov_2.739162:173-592(-)
MLSAVNITQRVLAPPHIRVTAAGARPAPQPLCVTAMDEKAGAITARRPATCRHSGAAVHRATTARQRRLPVAALPRDAGNRAWWLATTMHYKAACVETRRAAAARGVSAPTTLALQGTAWQTAMHGIRCWGTAGVDIWR